jgi:hypothetical protein
MAGRGTWGGVLICSSLLLQGGGVGDWKGGTEARLKRVGYVWWQGEGFFMGFWHELGFGRLLGSSVVVVMAHKLIFPFLL